MRPAEATVRVYGTVTVTLTSSITSGWFDEEVLISVLIIDFFFFAYRRVHSSYVPMGKGQYLRTV